MTRDLYHINCIYHVNHLHQLIGINPVAGELSKALNDNTVSPEEALQMMNDFVSGNQDMNKAAKNIEGMLGQIASTRTKAPSDPNTPEHPMDTPPDVAAPSNDDTHRFISNPNEMPDLTTGFTNPTLENVMQKTPDMGEQASFEKPPDSSVIKEPESFGAPVPAPVMKNIDTSVIPNEGNNNAPLYLNPQREAAKIEFEHNAQQSMEMEHANPMAEPELPHEQEQSFHGQPPEPVAFHQEKGHPLSNHNNHKTIMKMKEHLRVDNKSWKN